jgi:hypothetical protein
MYTKQVNGRPKGRHREQARSHSWTVYIQENWSAVRPPRYKSHPHRARVNPGEKGQTQARLLLTTSNTSLDN